MARLAYRLTAVEVEALKDKGLYPDGDGLYLRVTSTGTKSWIYPSSLMRRSALY
jgi:Arm DNA-binding domain